MATEIALLRLKPNTTLTSPSDALHTWQESLSTALSQPGAQRAYWGPATEGPTLVRLFIDWDSVAAHKTFMASDAYGPFVERLMSILAGVEGLYHANMTPHPPSAALSSETSPVTELLTLYLPAAYSDAQMAKFEAGFTKLADVVAERGADYCTASAGGGGAGVWRGRCYEPGEWRAEGQGVFRGRLGGRACGIMMGSGR